MDLALLEIVGYRETLHQNFRSKLQGAFSSFLVDKARLIGSPIQAIRIRDQSLEGKVRETELFVEFSISRYAVQYVCKLASQDANSKWPIFGS